MARLSVKGLAKYIGGTPAQQRKILQDYKFPDTSEPAAMRQYYQEATNGVRQFHRHGHEREWLRDQARSVIARAQESERASATRLRHNARGLLQYEQHFGHRVFEILSPVRMRLTFAGVQITLNPELHVTERGRAKLMKLEFSADAPTELEIRVIAQCLYEAANQQLGDFPSASVVVVDVTRGLEHHGARAGARTLREIEAACETISQLWPTITPPIRRLRRRP